VEVIVVGLLGVGTGFVFAIAAAWLVFRRLSRKHAVQFVANLLRGFQSSGPRAIWVPVSHEVVWDAVRSFGSTERCPMTVVLLEDVASAIEANDFAAPGHPRRTPHPN